MANRWDETWHRLREWTNGQAPSERLAAQILISEGFSDINPSHPLGGKDGGRDGACTRDGKPWITAVYFPRGQQAIKHFRKKLKGDLAKVPPGQAVGVAFVTNQELTLSERQRFIEETRPLSLEIFHLERITAILDKPSMAAVRKQFLDIDADSQIANYLGGHGGSAPGAGGGGGGAIGENAQGGDGGPGGKTIHRHGLDATVPGAGGGGAGATGTGSKGGGGGGGGEHVIAANVRLIPGQTIPIKIGRGGRPNPTGGDGEDGEDTEFGDLIRAKGGKGGKAGFSTFQEREVTEADRANGLRVSSLIAAEVVQVRNGLGNLLAAGVEHFSFNELPNEWTFPLFGTLSIGNAAAETMFKFAATIFGPDGGVVSEQKYTVFSGNSRAVSRPTFGLVVNFPIDREGVWNVSIQSGGFEFERLPIEIRLAKF
ncbi:glycine-rich domain-containing protein [Ralstonia solanacearum]|uniref:glycine-rich domain-containing protein n=1 Tax=Ralstonia solanacearum TaxID=305 RepID=UPI00202A4F66|nr:hypothetical protein [Ralstonia solanacearum]MCL9844270.1 hypothetical protein [Ralstonia solanacearum]MDC6256309.1 hypothetical protein [Ralstonia solanacearum]MDC6260897.1 hypothetical protein [Ralstonia solanacearum]MDC6303724.1 hypothetical protein [Ralstonia solanacearum]